MATKLSILDVNLDASGDLSSDQFKLMAQNGSGQAVLATTSGQKVLGPLINKPDAANLNAIVGVLGLHKVKYGGSVDEDDALMADASGLAIKATGVANAYIFGRAMVAGVSGDVGTAMMPEGVRHKSTGILHLPLGAFVEQDGTAIADFIGATSVIPGYSHGDESAGIRWNNASAPDPISIGVIVPPDFDSSVNATLKILAAKVGATVGDAVTWLVEVFNNVDGALYDADADYGGTSSAMTGDAPTKTCQLETLTLATANLPAAGAAMVLTIQPTDGTLGTDDVILLGTWIEYTRL